MHMAELYMLQETVGKIKQLLFTRINTYTERRKNA